jgi:phosphoglycolate phosphatase
MNDIFSKYQTIMFDLDGTLIDSASDLVGALNDTIADIFPQPIPYEGAKRLAGIGSRHLLRYAFDYYKTPYDDALIESYVPAFMNAYQKNMLDNTTAFAGAENLLITLKQNGKNLLLITNKPRRFTPLIIDFLGWTDLFDGIFCPDDVSSRKPSAAHLLEPLKIHNLNPNNALMVGDSITDYEAALAANIPVLIVGYYGQTHDEFPKAKYFINQYEILE